MTTIISVLTVLLAALIHALLQLGIGTLLLLYHSSLSRHIKKTTRALASSYIAGIGYITLISLAATCFVLSFVPATTVLKIVIVAVLALTGVLSWLIYYRASSGTELWVPAVVARYINGRAKLTKNNTESFSLGLLTFIGELPFSLVLLITAASAILTLPWHLQLFTVALYTLIVLAPVLAIRACIRQGKTVVTVQRWRVRHKNFFRLLIGTAFIALAAFVLAFKIIGV